MEAELLIESAAVEPADAIEARLRAMVAPYLDRRQPPDRCDCCDSDAPLSEAVVYHGDNITGCAQMCVKCILADCWPGDCQRGSE